MNSPNGIARAVAAASGGEENNQNEYGANDSTAEQFEKQDPTSEDRKDHARALLRTLDRKTTVFEFRTFDDSAAKRKALARNIRATLEDAWPALEALNREGAGVFVMVNEADGAGQKSDNVTRIRAVFGDTDGAPVEPLIAALKPHLVVESSPGRHHVYWRVCDCALEKFKPIQAAIAAAYGTDRNVIDLPRVMRLPGFYHHKTATPHLVLVTDLNNHPRYSVERITGGLKLKLGKSEEPKNQPSTQNAAPPETTENIVRVETMLAAIDPDPHPAGEGRNRGPYLRIIWAMASTGWTCAYQVARDWAATGDLFDQAAFDSDWHSFDPNGGIHFGTLVHYAKEAGWVDATPMPKAIQAVQESLNDAGNADRLLNAYGDQLAYVADSGRWLIRYQGRWHQDRKGKIFVLATDVMRGIYREAGKYAAMGAGLATSISNHAGRSLRAGAIEAAIKLASTATRIAVTSDQLDADNFLLGVHNGVLDLRAGTLRDEQREDWITRSARVTYDPSATAPTWLAFLDGIMAGNRDLIDFLQTLAGYCLTGDTREQKFFFFYGTGANGKSTFLNTLREMMGGYAVQARPEVLMVVRGGTQAHGHTADIMPLIGARLAAANETEEGQRLAESLIKQLTGGEPIMVRSPYGRESVLVMPQFKAVMAGNHRPIIRGTDHGIWRRLVCVPFTVTVPEEKQDKTLMDKLRSEFPGILNWALEGCLRWQAQGMSLPTILQSERAAYMTSMDILQRWIDETCEVVSGTDWGTRKAYTAFRNWAEAGGYGVVSEVRFTAQIEDKGFQRTRTRDGSKIANLRPRQLSLL
jgi:P4 family phage/plasmid primase-like protien